MFQSQHVPTLQHDYSVMLVIYLICDTNCVLGVCFVEEMCLRHKEVKCLQRNTGQKFKHKKYLFLASRTTPFFKNNQLRANFRGQLSIISRVRVRINPATKTGQHTKFTSLNSSTKSNSTRQVTLPLLYDQQTLDRRNYLQLEGNYLQLECRDSCSRN